MNVNYECVGGPNHGQIFSIDEEFYKGHPVDTVNFYEEPDLKVEIRQDSDLVDPVPPKIHQYRPDFLRRILYYLGPDPWMSPRLQRPHHWRQATVSSVAAMLSLKQIYVSHRRSEKECFLQLVHIASRR